MAASWLAEREPEEWPTGAPDRVVELLNEEAADPSRHDETELYGEYLVALVLAALALEDPRSLYGFAHLGIDVSWRAVEIVAESGSEGLTLLDDVWDERSFRRSRVLRTWGLILRSHTDQLTDEEVHGLRRRILDGGTDPESAAEVGFMSVVQNVPLPELVPVVEEMAESSPSEFIRSGAEITLIEDLRPMREETPLDELHDGLAEWLESICFDATGARRGACHSLEEQLTTAGHHMEADRFDPARNVLEAFAERADQAKEEGVLSTMEHRLLADNARSLAGRL